MLFIDSNIPMYLIGATHPHKIDARRALEEAISHQVRLVTDAEVFQEILHRYAAIGRRDAIAPAFALLSGLVDDVYPISLETVELARDIVQSYPSLSARDAVHVAAMKRGRVEQILSYDRGFDQYPGIKRVH